MPATLTARDACERALQAIGYLAAGETMNGDDGALVLGELNTMLDEWNAERAAVYTDVFSPWTLTANLAVHTIGPTGTFVVTQRPQTLDGASLQVGSTIWVDITVRDVTWWQGLAVPGLTSPTPTDVYYDAAWPNGALNFWPVPSVAAAITLWTRKVLGQLELTDTFTLPPGYRSAIIKTLGEVIAVPFEVPVPAQLAKDAATARARVFNANSRIPRLHTRDAGMPGGSSSGTRENRSGAGGAASRWSE
jgi:hypothetical protein